MAYELEANKSIPQELIDYFANLISKIDSGEASIFLEAVNTERQVEVKIFQTNKPFGVFFSCNIYEGLRASIALEEDTDEFNEEAAALIDSSLQKSAYKFTFLWIRNENKKLIEFLKERFNTRPDGLHYYASIEFIQHRASFQPLREFALVSRLYDENYIDEYLKLLDGSMTFTDTPMDYLKNKMQYINRFRERAADNSFEAFWKDDNLIGLYWRENFEIDTLAVAASYQRMGYGTEILSRAIMSVFSNTNSDFARLYAVDWNEKAQSFYAKYGMKASGHSYLLKLEAAFV